MANGRGGRRPGAGRKRKADELELTNLLNVAWPLTERRAAIERLVELSENGINKLDAIKLLLAYAYGKPVDRQEISGPGGDAVPIEMFDFVRPNDDQSDRNSGE